MGHLLPGFRVWGRLPLAAPLQASSQGSSTTHSSPRKVPGSYVAQNPLGKHSCLVSKISGWLGIFLGSPAPEPGDRPRVSQMLNAAAGLLTLRGSSGSCHSCTKGLLRAAC